MSEQSPEQAAALFPGASPEKRAEVLMRAGRIRVEAMPYVIAHMKALLTEREAAAYERGRREGLEEAARIVDEEYRGQGGTQPYTENTLLQIAGAIRQAGEERKNV